MLFGTVTDFFHPYVCRIWNSLSASIPTHSFASCGSIWIPLLAKGFTTATLKLVRAADTHARVKDDDQDGFESTLRWCLPLADCKVHSFALDLSLNGTEL